MVSASANLVGSRQSIDHKQKATKVSSVAFFLYVQKIRDRQTAALLSERAVLPKVSRNDKLF